MVLMLGGACSGKHAYARSNLAFGQLIEIRCDALNICESLPDFTSCSTTRTKPGKASCGHDSKAANLPSEVPPSERLNPTTLNPADEPCSDDRKTTLLVDGWDSAVRTEADRTDALRKLEGLARWEATSAARTVLLLIRTCGSDVVPLQAAHRRHRDELGFFTQAAAAACRTVIRVWCGLPETLKDDTHV